MEPQKTTIPATSIFLDRSAVEHWLSTQPPAISTLMAARAGLRALPLIIALWNNSSSSILPFFRAAQATWAFVKFPNTTTKAAVSSASYPVISENSEAGAAIMLARASCTLRARNEIANFAARALSAAVRSASAIGDDALLELAQINNSNPTPEQVDKFATNKLWQNGMPEPIADAWFVLKRRIETADEDWDVWINWYEERLAGGPSLSEAFDIAVATLPDELWEKGPRPVNARIKELIAEHTLAALPSAESLPTQTGRAAVFGPEPSGIIGVVPPALADRLAETKEVQDLYSETRDKLDDLIALGRNMLGDRLDRASRRLQSRMPEPMSEAIERQIWSSGNTLRSIRAAHDAVKGDYDPHPDKLDNGVAERLRDVVDTFNQLAIADPSLRQRDAGRPGPQEHQRTLDEIEIVEGAVAEAARDRNLTSQPAGEQLLESIVIANEAGSSLTDRLAVELTRDTDRNFVAGIVTSVYGALRKLPSLARGEGGFISKEFFSGVYKYAGGAAVAGVAGAVAGGYYIRWEIIEFIVSNADQLRLYGAFAFEQSPGFKQMIDWLEAHVRIEKK